MKMLLYGFIISTGIAAAFGLYVLSKTKRLYEKGEAFSAALSLGWWITDTAWTALVALSSLYNVLPLWTEERISLVSGASLLGIGIALTVAGAVEFRSLRKISGMEVSRLITTGIYRWSKNPQFLGFYLALLGISLLGRSGYALLLTVIAIIYCHYYIVKTEEPYLERVFGEEYIAYRSRTPRYIGVPKSEERC